MKTLMITLTMVLMSCAPATVRVPPGTNWQCIAEVCGRECPASQVACPVQLETAWCYEAGAGAQCYTSAQACDSVAGRDSSAQSACGEYR
jgi:hypothetical protein